MIRFLKIIPLLLIASCTVINTKEVGIEYSRVKQIEDSNQLAFYRGYKITETGLNRYEVLFYGTYYTSREDIKRGGELKALELGLENGFENGFMVVNKEQFEVYKSNIKTSAISSGINNPLGSTSTMEVKTSGETAEVFSINVSFFQTLKDVPEYNKIHSDIKPLNRDKITNLRKELETDYLMEYENKVEWYYNFNENLERQLVLKKLQEDPRSNGVNLNSSENKEKIAKMQTAIIKFLQNPDTGRMLKTNRNKIIQSEFNKFFNIKK